MSLKAFEDACIRAELFGQPKPNKEDFLEKNKHLDVTEFEEVEIKTAENMAMLDDQVKDASGGLAELNTILNSTQSKLNRIKGVCGSLTNFFRIKLNAKDNLSYSTEPSYIGQTNYDKDYIPPKKSNNLSSINEGLGPDENEMFMRGNQNGGASSSRQDGGGITAALNDLEEMEINENTSMISKAALKDVGKQMTSQIMKMSLKAFEDACIRAELFGQPKPNKEDFLEKNKHLDVTEFEEVEIKTAENMAMLDDQVKDASGGLAELNTILNSTQSKLNRIKGVCGSLTNFFRIKLNAKDNLSYSTEPSYIGQTNYDKDYIPPKKSNNLSSINEGLGPDENEMFMRGNQNGGASSSRQDGGGITAALNDLEEMEINENTSMISKAALKDVGKQMTSQISKLDLMIGQADRAQSSLHSQNKQMRSFLK
ncbi:uncharacterized protein LOC106129922 [Amyelois transitella]|uniref:uncharacterized protein LOC106129922 n=1 Tax=Amyelois transitella TaxID=680683 RepID=UPI0029900854|nr:uncharacterized protein LOC106129922 [Amyelois transitella]